MATCKTCKNAILDRNKSGYCKKCYSKSPQFLKYQRDYQKKIWYSNPANKRKKLASSKKWRKKNPNYMKKYNKKHIDRIRCQKREWARKQREKK